MEEAAKVHDNGKRGERVGAGEGGREGEKGGEEEGSQILCRNEWNVSGYG